MGNVPETTIYRRMDQYTTTRTVPGVLVLRVDSPIYFANSGNMRERITWWIDDDERTSAKGKTGVQYIVLDMGGKLQQLGVKFCPHVSISSRACVKLVLSGRSSHQQHRQEGACWTSSTTIVFGRKVPADRPELAPW
jgi:sulfate transporter 3